MVITDKMSDENSPILKLKDISVGTRLLPFSTNIYAGRLIHLIGPNGSGKSTLLARIAGMLHGGGTVFLDGCNIETISGKELARLRGYLCQQQTPGVLMPIFQYLALHQPHSGTPQECESVVSFLADILGLSDKLSRSLTALSGGEWQRVRLAAAFLQVWPTLNSDSKLLLLDEPMNSLDIGQQAALDELITLLCKEGRTVICSGHDLNHTLHYADDVLLLSEGVVINTGVAEEIMQPEKLGPLFGVEFQTYQLGKRNLIVVKERIS